MAKTIRRKFPAKHGLLASDGLVAAREHGGRPLRSILDHLEECFTREAAAAIGEGLGLIPNPGVDTAITPEGLSPDQIDKIISAATIPLAGSDSVPARVRSEATAKAERLAMHQVLSPGVNPQTWWISSKGIVHRTAPTREPPAARERHPFYSIYTEEHYAFDETSALVRTAAFDKVTNTSNMSIVRVRKPGQQRPVTRDEAYGALAALLAAFGPLRFSLTGAGDKQVLNRIAEIEMDARSLARRLKKPELSILRHEGSEALEVLCDAYADRFQRVYKMLGRSEKQPQALTHLIGPAIACFELLFAPATRGTRETPFTRFVVAFLRELGCAYEWSTINRHLARWRNERRKSARTCASRVHSRMRKKGSIN